MEVPVMKWISLQLFLLQYMTGYIFIGAENSKDDDDREQRKFSYEGGDDFQCYAEGLFPDENDCSSYYRCVLYDTESSENSVHGPNFVRLRLSCPTGTVFDTATRMCLHLSRSSRLECNQFKEILAQMPNSDPAYSEYTRPLRSSDLYRQSEGKCETEGFFPTPGDCTKFYRCVASGSGFIRYEFGCGPGTIWDLETQACNHPWAVNREECRLAMDNTNTNNGQGNEIGDNNIPPAQNSEISSGMQPDSQQNPPPNNFVQGSYGQPPSNHSPQQPSPSSENQNPPLEWNQPQNSGENQPTNPDYGLNPNENPSSSVWNPNTNSPSQSPSPTSPEGGNNPVENPEKNPLENPNSVNENPGISGKCRSEGYMAIQGDCMKFIRCVPTGNGGYSKYEFECGTGTVWDSNLNTCNYPNAVDRTDCKLESSGTEKAPCTTNVSEPSNGQTNSETTSTNEQTTNQNQQTSEQSTIENQQTSTNSNQQSSSSSQQSSSTSNSTESTNSQSSTSSFSSSQQTSTNSNQQTSSNQQSSSSQQTSTNSNHQASSSQQTSTSSSQQSSGNQQTSTNSNVASNNQQTSTGTSQQSENNQEITTSEQSTSSGNKPQSASQVNNQTKPVSGNCESEGFFPDPNSCNKFYRCVNNSAGTFTKYDFDCGPGTVWDQSINNCNHPWAVQGKCNPLENQTDPNNQTSGEPPMENNTTTNSNVDASTTNKPAIRPTQATTTKNPNTGTTTKKKPVSSSTPIPSTSTTTVKSTVSTITTTQRPVSSQTLMPATNRPSNTKPSTTATKPTPSKKPSPTPQPSSTVQGSSKKPSSQTQQPTTMKQQTSTTKPTTNSPSAQSQQPGSTIKQPSSTVKPTDESLPSSTLEANPSSTPETNPSSTINSTTSNPNTSTTFSPAGMSSKPNVTCNKAGFYPLPGDCKKFYRCVDWDGDKGERFSVYYFDCPEGTIFDPAISVCNHEESVYPPRDCSGIGNELGGQKPSETLPNENNATAATDSNVPQSTTTGSQQTTIAETSETTTDSAMATTNQPESSNIMTTPGLEATTVDNSDKSTTISPVDETTTPLMTMEPNESTTLTNNENSTPANNENSTPNTESTTPTSENTTPANSENNTPSNNESTTSPNELQNNECPSKKPDQMYLVCPTGFRRHPKHCNLFYQCTISPSNEIKVVTLSCTNGTMYDNEKIQCLPPGETEQCEGNMASTNARGRRNDNSISPIPVPGKKPICSQVGSFPFNNDCNLYVKCEKSNSSELSGFLYQCPEDKIFSTSAKKCERKSNAKNEKCARNSNNPLGKITIAPTEGN